MAGPLDRINAAASAMIPLMGVLRAKEAPDKVKNDARKLLMLAGGAVLQGAGAAVLGSLNEKLQQKEERTAAEQLVLEIFEENPELIGGVASADKMALKRPVKPLIKEEADIPTPPPPTEPPQKNKDFLNDLLNKKKPSFDLELFKKSREYVEQGMLMDIDYKFNYELEYKVEPGKTNVDLLAMAVLKAYMKGQGPSLTEGDLEEVLSLTGNFRNMMDQVEASKDISTIDRDITSLEKVKTGKAPADALIDGFAELKKYTGQVKEHYNQKLKDKGASDQRTTGGAFF